MTQVNGQNVPKVVEKGADPIFDRGAITNNFLYPTGQEIPGGFFASLQFSIKPPLVEVGMGLKGEIRHDGYFGFSGEVTLKLNLPDLSITVAKSEYGLDSSNGLWVKCKYGLLGQTFSMEGKINAGGASMLSDVNIDFRGSGIKANLALDTAANPKFTFKGDIRLFYRTIVSGDIKITNNEVGARFQLGLSWIGLEVKLGLQFAGDFSCSAFGAFYVDCGWIIGRIRIGIGGSVSSNGTIAAEVGIGKAGFNFQTGKFSWEWTI
jgi:hypothetical protein